MTGQRRALLIATDRYADPTFQQLRAPRADTDALTAVLADPAVGGYEVVPLHNPPAHEANLAIEDLFATAWLDDVVLLYISGHGIKDDYGQLHLAMTNSRQDRLNATAVSAQFVRNQMDNTRSRRVVVVLDCCFAGAFPPGATHRAGENADVLSQLGGRGSAVMTSSSALEYSFEAGEAASSTLVGTASPSVFTGALVDGLRSGRADRNADGLIDVDELYDFIYERVEAGGRPQTPGLDSRFQGRLIVASSPAAIDLPHEVAQAMRSSLPSVRLAVVGELSALLTSDSAREVRAARTALWKLTEDNVSFVVTAARAALARAETAMSLNTTVDMNNEVGQQNSARSAPVTPPASLIDDPATGQDAGERQQAEASWLRSALIGTITAVASAAAIMAVLMPDFIFHRDTDATPSFVPPPTRSTPLPDRVACQYTPIGKESTRPVKPPNEGKVGTKGIVWVTINTNIGRIPARLDRSLAPCTVNNFVHLAKSGFYDNTGCSGGKVPFLGCGGFPFDDGSPGYTTSNENFPELRRLRGYLTIDPTYYPGFSVFFEDNDQSEDAVLGTVSEEGLKVIDNKLSESDDTYNHQLRDITVLGVEVQG